MGKVMILTALLCNQRLTRKILLAAYRNCRSGYKMLKEYQSEGLIEEVRYDGMNVPVLKITKKGIARLAADSPSGWAKHIDLSMLQRRKGVGGVKGKNQSRSTFAAVSEANAFCLFAGFDTVLLPHLPSYTCGGTITDRTLSIVHKAVKDFDREFLGEGMLKYTVEDASLLGDGYARFIPKTYFEKVTGLGGRDFASTKAVGFADSRYKSLLVYDYFRGNGHVALFKGSPDDKVYPVLAARSLCREISFTACPCGVMMVEDPGHFSTQFVFNRASRTRSMNIASHPEESTFADGYAHFYIVPKTREGGNHLRWLMTADDAEVESDVISLFASRPGASTDGRSRLFPLSYGGIRYAVGCTLDMPFLKAILEHIAEHGREGIGIICFRWQIPYYSALTGDITFLEVELG